MWPRTVYVRNSRLTQALTESIKEDITRAQDEKLNLTYKKLKQQIANVANAPVSISISDEQKHDIIGGLESRVGKLEKR